MKRKTILFKLWLAMLVLITAVLVFSGLIQAGILQKIYLEQQSGRIIESGLKLAGSMDISDKPQLNSLAENTADTLGASVLVVNSQGEIIVWKRSEGAPGMGMGMGMGHGAGMGMGMGMGYGMQQKINAGMPFTSADVSKVLAGEQLVRREYNPYFKTDIMQVGIPAEKNGRILGAVMIQTPLAPIVNNLRALQQSSLYALALGGLAAVLLALLLARGIVQPLLKMNRAARSMAEGDYDIQVPVESKDEIGILGESINLLSAKLKEKISQLEKMDNTRREFVASVSHELRTPLTIIQGYTEALVDGMDRDQAQKEQYLSNILEETNRLKRLVDDLLNLGRMEAGRVTIEVKEVDMLAVVRRVMERFESPALEKGRKLLVEATGGSYMAKVNEDKMEQVIINLVDNALRFTPPGGAVNAIIDRTGSQIRISVKDSGSGIPEREQPLVWDRFYKSDPSRSRGQSGSGLGLAIVRGIVELHGGQVGVQSRPDEGATFWFTVPAV
ncbi:osmosensitive K+ channel histidine kinase KdpD [Desulfocucumis palustris]|uniref:histidine kinase n=1 Tax=Desulfocucumis palustris TaxID=1898651 RepID=A0A2L2XF60_9FIRM|nr:ATP-binding protein [Desulfocucumis palustris]GBF34989.1 osmosensitive K+ channel histidine kinase KdpD [Desulfocucumis palustris]